MASLLSTAWYVNSVSYAAITAWSAAQTWTVGQLIRQVSPTQGNERVFVCIVAGAGGATTEPTWVLTRGAKTVDASATWMEVSGHAALCADTTNTMPWAASSAAGLGLIIKNVSGGADTIFICTTSSGNTTTTEPTWNKTLGATTADASNVWTSLGPISSLTKGAAAAARLSLAIKSTWAASGNYIYVSDNHSQTSSTFGEAYTFPGTSTTPVYVICAKHAGSYPPVSADVTTGATVTLTGATSTDIAFNGFGYFYGITFQSSSTDTSGGISFFGASTAGFIHMESCSFVLSSTSTQVFNIGGGNAVTVNAGRRLRLTNCTISFAAVGSTIAVANADVRWDNTPSALAGAAVPTNLFNSVGSTLVFTSNVTLEGVDLSAAGSGKTLVAAGIGQALVYSFINCKFGSGVTVAGAALNAAGPEVYVTNSDSANTTTRAEKYTYEGTLITDTTDVRSGGAAANGTAFAWEVTTTANNTKAFPFECPLIAVKSTLVGSTRTVSIPIMSNATLTNADVWPEVLYMGSTSTPLGTLANGRVADLLQTTTPTSWALDSVSSWTTTGVTGPVKQMLSVSFTPEQVGDYLIRIKIAKPSQTLRIDPMPQLT
jgi:hypothetical protein